MIKETCGVLPDMEPEEKIRVADDIFAQAESFLAHGFKDDDEMLLYENQLQSIAANIDDPEYRVRALEILSRLPPGYRDDDTHGDYSYE